MICYAWLVKYYKIILQFTFGKKSRKLIQRTCLFMAIFAFCLSAMTICNIPMKPMNSAVSVHLNNLNTASFQMHNTAWTIRKILIWAAQLQVVNPYNALGNRGFSDWLIETSLLCPKNLWNGTALFSKQACRKLCLWFYVWVACRRSSFFHNRLYSGRNHHCIIFQAGKT